jgi:phthiocerol/phenolphthiocerol synthesis type-I polyketide synthase E
MMKNSQQYTGLEVAVVGMACRFPGAATWRQYWHNLVHEVESIHFFTEEELMALGMERDDIHRPDFVNAGAVLENKSLFDAAFFGYRPDEARFLNPMHRVFHECVWEALEDAGYDPGNTKGAIGLYAGGGDDLNWKVYSTLKNSQQEVDGFTLGQLSNKDYLATLLSYKLNIKGPALSVNTACSTSLVAINLACKSLLMGEVKMALAGGVSVNTQQQKGYFYVEGMIDAKDGHCRAFDAAASGAVGGEGAGVVALKRLQDAINDGDHIYAVIKGSAINNDGNRKVGFTAPSIEGQVDCIRKALSIADIKPHTVGYVEAHGTGTRLGDPIEIEALNIAFNRNRQQPCAIGSVKTNIGHLDTAAGVAGFIKAALSLKFRQLPASLHFKTPNPEIDFNGGPFYVNATAKQWEPGGAWPLRAGVSSFGIGGTNAHVILEEAPLQQTTTEGRSWKLFTISAKTPASLGRYRQEMKQFLQQATSLSLSDMSYTLQAGRKHFPYRQTIAYKEKADLLSWLGTGTPVTFVKDTKPGIVFLFPGQGAQYAGMVKELYEQEEVMRAIIDQGCRLFAQQTGVSLADSWFAAAGDHTINDTRYTQPAIFILEYAMAKLLLSWGISPRYMIGHSVGEYVAACISGVFTFDDALKLLIRRGALIAALPAGIMISISISEAAANNFLCEGLSLAAVNGPEQVVLSGNPEAAQALMDKLAAQDIPYVRLRTSHAFHSAMLDGILQDFRYALEQISWQSMNIPFVSNVTGELITAALATSPDYWVRHLRETVLFSAGVHTLLETPGELLFVEVGAGHILSGLVKQQSPAAATFQLIRSARDTTPDGQLLAEGLGQLWAHGIDIDWQRYYANEGRRRVPLPTYSFEPVKYPAEVNPFEYGNVYTSRAVFPARAQEWSDWVYYPVWRSTVFFPPAAKTKSFLLFSPGNTFLNPLKALLLAGGYEVTEVVKGTVFSEDGARKYSIDPAEKAHYRQLFAALGKEKIIITDIVYAWGIDAADEALRLERGNSTLDLVYFSPANLVQAMAEQQVLHGIRMAFVTNTLHNVTGASTTGYSQSLLLGFLNVVPQEFPVSCCNIDIDVAADAAVVIPGLVRELVHTESHDRIIALRGGQRWIRDYQKNTLPVKKDTTVIQKGGVYLITGGLGNVGYLLAKHLVTVHQAKVVLTGRRRPEDGAGEENWQLRLKQLQGLSPEVHYYCCDVTDIHSLEETVLKINAAVGNIQGVIHAAGNIDRQYFELAEEITYEKSMAILAPKIAGIKNLHQVFKTATLDFVWITSSLATVLGGLSFTAYAAANLFMDHYVAALAAELPVWKCIGLSEMLFDEQEALQENETHRKALKPAEIAALFEWSAGIQQVPVILQTITSLPERIHIAYHTKRAGGPDTEYSLPVAVKLLRPELGNAYEAAASATEEALVTIMQAYFGFEKIGVTDDFFELGGDSLKAMMLLKRIKKEFSIPFTVHDFFESRSIRQMAVEIDNRLWLGQHVENKFTSII